MPANVPKAVCFLAMPFGKKAPLGKKSPRIDFDEIRRHFSTAVKAEELEPVRADFELAGGFIHKQMFERLLVAEYVIADLTLSNPNVMYEVGVRHASSARPTVLVCGDAYMGDLPFDVRTFRVIPYHLNAEGRLTGRAATRLKSALRKRLRLARQGRLPVDNPIMQVTSWAPGGDVQHEKTDVFLDRMAFVGTIGERIRAAIARKVDAAAVKALSAIERELLEDGRDVPQYHSAWLGVYLGYRERKAYDKMVALFPKLPKELRQTAVAREQLALALNRLAERADRRGRRGVKRARELRRQALAELDKMPRKMVTSETCGIRGRIYKGWHDAEAKAGRVGRAQGMLSRAIETYEQGLRLDARDFYPGVNAVTLRLLRGTPRDLAAVARIAPVVRFAVESAPAPKSEEERYWRAATKLELAGADRDWTAADRYLTEALGIDAQDWMFETTVKNLRIQRAAFVRDEEAVERLDEIIECLVD